TPRQVGIAVALVVPLLAISIGADAIGRAVSPGVYEQLQQVLNAMSSHVTNPFIAIIIGLTAGIGEEILFRGAIQPRFGIAVTALAFAVAHTQYGFSFAIAGVFVTGIVLGYERKTMNTTACIITHATYDILALLLAYFAGAGLGG
ncbi:MAG: lysostaphin resistance A-like protein, partial [Thermomicrobiales bacterium]